MTSKSAKALDGHEADGLYRRTLGVLIPAAVLSLSGFVLLRNAASSFHSEPNATTALGSSVEAAAFRYRCDQAMEDAREAIDYSADPCEDFHAYACNPRRGSKMGQLDSERNTLQRVLLELSLRGKGDDVVTQAAMMFKSCLDAPRSLNVTIRKNHLDFLEIVNFTTEVTFGSVNNHLDVVNISALLAHVYGIRSFMRLQSGPNGSVAVSFARPFSAYLNRSTVRAIFRGVKELLGTPSYESSGAVDNIVDADEELATILTKASTVRVTIESLVNTTEPYVSRREWETIIEAYNSRDAGESTARAGGFGVEKLQAVFAIIFDKLDSRESAIYSTAHAFLPAQLLEVQQSDHRTDACFRLVENTFGASWRNLVPYLLGLFDENHEVQSMAESLVSTFERMRRKHRSLFSRDTSGAAVVAKLKQLRFSAPKLEEDLVIMAYNTPCRGNLSGHSLYRNLMQCSRSNRRVRPANNGTVRRKERWGLPTITILMSSDTFRPASFCHDRDSPFNYATLGTSMAATFLRYATEQQSPFASSSAAKGTVFDAALSNVTTCLARTSPELRGTYGWLLEEISLQTVAFQAALRASESRPSVWRRLKNAADAPAWKQTYFVKYCQSLCAKDVSKSSTAAKSGVALACNMVVMNSPKFAELFRCEHGDRMVPTEYCLAL
ncbi:hypothetical protein HPB50_024341 [Hyalomma asiaticum]|uniref:Uncharacterized protein n=1 Tax=Hyalomma asiaticum TaxID=266040 RepID=A0ACB7T9E1_HYAAI|nr:hypothetical protein HPB50_024341 [Hyalomma asiaticum]